MENLLFALLRFEFFGKELSIDQIESLRGLGEEQSKKLFALSKKHDMAHVVANALLKNDLIKKDNVAYSHYVKEQMLCVYRYENQKHELQNVRELFIKNGIEFVALKGAYIRQYYNQPELRIGCDVDVLIKKDDLKKATSLLTEKLGYVTEGKEHFHDIILRSPTDVTIELHFSIQEGIAPMDDVLNKVWGYAKELEDSGCEKRLTGAYTLFYLVAHTAYHFINGGCGIKPFVDLLVLEQKMPYDKAEFNDLLQRAELTIFYKQMLKIAKVWFDGESDDETTALAKEYILTGGVYGTVDNAIAVKRATSQSKSAYFWSRIFLPYDSLKIVFPILKKHKWLFPFCQIARWFKALFGGRGKTFSKELEVSKGVTTDQKQKLSKLFNDVGLPLQNKL